MAGLIDIQETVNCKTESPILSLLQKQDYREG